MAKKASWPYLLCLLWPCCPLSVLFKRKFLSAALLLQVVREVHCLIQPLKMVALPLEGIQPLQRFKRLHWAEERLRLSQQLHSVGLRSPQERVLLPLVAMM